MTQLAIKGHPTRGEEVIEILEMMGYFNFHDYTADTNSLCFYGSEITNRVYYDWVNSCEDMLIFTLEEFLEKFPYKVGDKVVVKGLSEYPKSIHFMKWFADNIHYSFDNETWFLPSALNLYKEETMEDRHLNPKANSIAEKIKQETKKVKEFFESKMNLTIQDIRDNNAEWLLNKLQEMSAESALQTISDLYDKLHKPQYPKTYVECINRFNSTVEAIDYKKIRDLNELIYCRNAYWKIAGEQMGLGKPWEPDWESESTPKYTISQAKNKIRFLKAHEYNHILSFPTAEMREAFYENFKYLIESCKELL